VSCRAGALGDVVRANGDVFPCEILDERLGGLREMDFDFKKIWRSERAREVRGIINKSECACTYECFMTLNVLFDPIASLDIAREWAVRRAGGRRV
jgi:radical SAM protein with 4Fe4S-binding SPASM domain